MSTINKMSIRGIRSFGCEKQDEQKIVFSSPLTLIVGQNGCGKTTIIESLKYALTGEMPPGSDGKTFVHDPKVFKTTSSLGQVKLMVTDTMGRSKTCVRSIKCDVQKGGKMKFATVDSVIITEDSNGKREEGGRRVKDINNEMAKSMGVSEAILNNVIFCHQEDSNWPLDEGAKLKKKFDAIFGTTEYNKAIEKIIKHRKTYQDKLKDCVLHKRHLEETKRDADRKLLEHEKLQTKHEAMAAKVAELEAQLIPVNEEITKLLAKSKSIGKLQGNQAIYESSIKNCETNFENTKKKIKTLLKCSVTEIEEQLKSFAETQKLNEEKLILLRKECKISMDNEKKYRESIVEAKSKMDTICDNMGKKQEIEHERLEAIKKLSSDLNIPMNDDVDTQSLTDNDLISSLAQIRQEIVSKEKDVMNLVSQGEKHDRELQRGIDKQREEKATSETNLKTRRDQLSKLNQRKEQMKTEISSIESSMPMFNKLIEKIAATEGELKEIKSNANLEDVEKQKAEIQMEKSEFEEKMTVVEEEIDKLESIFAVTNELEMKEKDLTKDQQDFDRLRNKNASALKELFPRESLDRNFKNKIQSLSENLKSNVRQIKENLHKSEMEKNRLQTKRQHLQDQQNIKTRDITETKQKIYEICDGEDYEGSLFSQKEKVEKLNMDLAHLKSSDEMFKRYIVEIKQTPGCPLCHKNLESNESIVLQEEIEEKINTLPQRIASAERKLKKENEIFDKLNGLKSAHENLGKLEKEAQQYHDDLLHTKREYEKLQASIADDECLLADPESKLNTISSTFFSDMCRLDELARTIQNKSTDVKNLRAKLPEEMPSKSLTEAKCERSSLNLNLKSKNDLLNHLNKKTNETHAKINSVQDKLNTFVSQKMAHQEKFQGLDRMKTQLKEMENEKLELQKKIQEEEMKLSPLSEELNKLILEKQTHSDDLKRKRQERQKIVDEVKKQESEVERYNKAIKSYEAMQLETKLTEVKEKISESEKRIKQTEADVRKSSKEIELLNKEVTNQETYQRNLQDNMELHKIEIEKRTAEESLAKLLKEMGDLNPEKIQKDYKYFHNKRDTITEERQTIRGSLKESEDRIEASAKELNESRYKKAKENYMKICNNEAATKAIINDLHKYRAVLERSLLKYHGDKMTEINQTIRELWNNIYKGNDIDYIMIKTDEEEATTAVSDKKRSYNYRVVQAKNGGAEIDMRGRCSAGQKVLASLIIRMALADTFSANCGILALDEPTTNLDQTNINALCQALSRIVEEREKTGNFMLLVITHDMEFVTNLERAEHYFKLSRDPLGRSRIEKIENYR